MSTSRMHNRVTWLGLIRHSEIVNRRVDPCFILLLRCYHFSLGTRASYNETFCITSTIWGKWSHVDDYRFGGKLPKHRIEKAQVQTTIQQPQKLWWWTFKRWWLLIPTRADGYPHFGTHVIIFLNSKTNFFCKYFFSKTKIQKESSFFVCKLLIFKTVFLY